MWYGVAWWWWWIFFIAIFFLLPLGYGWGYRGWGPWYRRRKPGRPRSRADLPSLDEERVNAELEEEGWGWMAIALWFVLLIAIIWGGAGFYWGGRWR